LKPESPFNGLSNNTPNFLIAINLIEDKLMIDCNILKRLVLEVFSANPYTPVKEVVTDVEKLAAYQNVFPSRKDCHGYDIYNNYYGKKRLSPLDRENINHIIWQLIHDNLLLIEEDRLN
jgi:hypothetical protein